MRFRGVDAGFDDVLLRQQAVVAAVDVFQLRAQLVPVADQQRPLAGVARVPRDQDALAVEHLQYGKFRQVGETTALQRHVGQQNGIGTGLVGDAAFLRRRDQAGAHQMLDAIGRAAALDA